MSVNELQALARQFSDAFDQRDLQPILDMLSEDVEVFDHVPYRFDGKALFAKYLNEVIASLASASFGLRQPSCRVYGDTVGIVNAHDRFMGVTKDGKALSIHGRTTLVFIKQSGEWKIVSAHFSAIPMALWESSQGIRALGGAP
jgi:ketosteroid isomerase-like protein